MSRSSADGGAKARAEAHSAGINEAYKTLCDPLRRAEYLLELRGSDQRASSRDTERIESADHTAPFLSTIMEIRESIEAATEMSEIEMLKRENEERIEHSVRVLEEAFERDEVGRAKSEVERLRYWVSIREGLEGWEGRN